MFDDITLLIPTHNRHGYLRRIIDFYKGMEIRILVADSTPAHFPGILENNVTYLHLPDLMLPQKLAQALLKVKSTYVAMCADDDFLIPSGIAECVSFLQSHDDYSSAQGNVLVYHKTGMFDKKVKFNPAYLDISSRMIDEQTPLKRLKQFFNPYRTIFSSIHRTVNLKYAYSSELKIRNLYLNEYLSGIIPICAGKNAELPIFYQVREFSSSSDDKLTLNIDGIIQSEACREEYEWYKAFIVNTLQNRLKIFANNLEVEIELILAEFAMNLKKSKLKKPVPLKKQIGKKIMRLPILGKTLINFSRKLEGKKSLSLLIKSGEDRDGLSRVEQFIKSYAYVV